ncbi:tyrosine-type recombinase/integrase [Streptomyces sp. NPDC045456]|uniref:tyrosine-type recombinase/integrase n=1 Tax=unclassified Streptomyces TaxID=2593676 RepID=UPI0033D4B43A
MYKVVGKPIKEAGPPMATVFQKCKTDSKSKEYPCEKSRCGHVWTVRYREPGGRGGRQREKSFVKKGDADKFATKVERDKDLGAYIDPEGAKTPLVVMYRKFIDSGETVTGSKRNYEASLNRNIEPFFGGQTIGSIKPADIQAWLKWMKEVAGYADSTTVVRYRVLSSVFNFAVNNELLARNPCHRVKVKQAKALRKSKKKIQIPTLEEIAAIAVQLPEQLELVAWLMAGLGLRIAEALALTLEQFDFERGVVYVDRQIVADGENEEAKSRAQRAATKGRGRALKVRHLKWRDSDEGREVPVGSAIARKVLAHVKRFGTFRVEEGPNRMAGSYLFSNISRTNIMSLAYMDRLWNIAVKAAALARKVKKHWLRHFFASAALSRGVPVNEVAAWLGHTDPKVTYQMYGHVMPDAPERMRSVMDSVLDGGINLGLPEEIETLADAA